MRPGMNNADSDIGLSMNNLVIHVSMTHYASNSRSVSIAGSIFKWFGRRRSSYGRDGLLAWHKASIRGFGISLIDIMPPCSWMAP